MEGTRDETHGRAQPHTDPREQSVTRLGRSTLLLNSKAPELAPQVEPASPISKPPPRPPSLPAVLAKCSLQDSALPEAVTTTASQ